LVKYYPQAKREDWKLITAGQRVQVIKRDPETGKTSLQFGTEIVADKDGSIAALLGASPGASTSPSIMLSVLAKAFPKEMEAGWKTRLKAIVPSYGEELNKSAALTNQIRHMTSEALHLPYVEVPEQPSANLQPSSAAESAVQPQPEVIPTDKRDNTNSEMQEL
jgi:malate dehydrogenase (quinone)